MGDPALAVQELDFSQDKEDWANLTDERRTGGLVLSSFFIGEERVTTQFSAW